MGCDELCMNDYEKVMYNIRKGERERDNLCQKELERTDIKCLENAENLPGIKLDSPKPAIKKNGNLKENLLNLLIQERKLKLII